MDTTLSLYPSIEKALKQKSFADAEQKLNQIQEKGSHWHYLYSLVLLEKAWFDSALSHIEKAIELDPSRSLYQETKNKFFSRYNRYTDPYYNSPHYRRRSGCCCCCDDCCGDIGCCELICLDSCCECMGGDLITCI